MFRSIQLTLIITIILISLLPILLVLFFALQQFETASRQQSINQFNAVAKAKYNDLERWLQSSQAIEALILSNTDQYQNMINLLVSSTRMATISGQTAKYLRDQLAVQNVFTEFFIYNLDG